MKSKNIGLRTMILACCFCMPLFAYSQKTVEFQDLNKERNEANFSFNEKNYSLAYNQYSVIIKRYMSIADHHFNFSNQTVNLFKLSVQCPVDSATIELFHVICGNPLKYIFCIFDLHIITHHAKGFFCMRDKTF